MFNTVPLYTCVAPAPKGSALHHALEPTQRIAVRHKGAYQPLFAGYRNRNLLSLAKLVKHGFNSRHIHLSLNAGKGKRSEDRPYSNFHRCCQERLAYTVRCAQELVDSEVDSVAVLLVKYKHNFLTEIRCFTYCALCPGIASAAQSRRSMHSSSLACHAGTLRPPSTYPSPLLVLVLVTSIRSPKYGEGVSLLFPRSTVLPPLLSSLLLALPPSLLARPPVPRTLASASLTAIPL